MVDGRGLSFISLREQLEDHVYICPNKLMWIVWEIYQAVWGGCLFLKSVLDHTPQLHSCDHNVERLVHNKAELCMHNWLGANLFIDFQLNWKFNISVSLRFWEPGTVETVKSTWAGRRDLSISNIHRVVAWFGIITGGRQEWNLQEPQAQRVETCHSTELFSRQCVGCRERSAGWAQTRQRLGPLFVPTSGVWHPLTFAFAERAVSATIIWRIARMFWGQGLCGQKSCEEKTASILFTESGDGRIASQIYFPFATIVRGMSGWELPTEAVIKLCTNQQQYWVSCLPRW